MVLIDALIFDDNTVHERLGLHDSKTNFSVHGILSQEYWSRLPFPSSGDLSDQGIKPRSSALQADSLPSEPPWSKKEVNSDSTNVFFLGSDLLSFLESFQVHIFIAIYELLKPRIWVMN